MTGGTRSTPQEQDTRRQSPSRLLLSGALVLGLAIGGALGVSIGAVTDDDAVGTAPAPFVASDTPGQDSPRHPEAEAGISDACLRAVAAAERTYDLIDDLGSALLHLDARRLDEVVHELRPLQDQLEQGTATCRVDVRRPDDPTGSGPLSPAPPTPSSPRTSPAG
ncbi:hypothetical protein ACI784_23250 [Geodermatophilus sp. SYSU D01186]